MTKKQPKVKAAPKAVAPKKPDAPKKDAAAEPTKNLPAVIPPAVSAAPLAPPARPAPKPEALGDLENLEVDCRVIEAAILATAKSDVRGYTEGVLLRERDGFVEVIATNGHLMLVQRLAKVEKMPAWAKGAGVIVQRSLLGKLSKLQGEGKVLLRYGKGHKQVVGRTSPDFATFKLDVIPVQFPSYEKILEQGGKAMQGGEAAPLSAPALDPAYVKVAAQVGAVLEAKSVFTFLSQDGSPSVFTFGVEASAAALYVMPKQAGAAMSDATVKMLAPALRGSVAALRAHITRTKEAEKKASSKSEGEALAKKRIDIEARLASIIRAGVAKLEDKRPS